MVSQPFRLMRGQTTARFRTPLREILRTQTASSAVLLAAALAGLLWANVGGDSYLRLWNTDLAMSFGSHTFALTLREAVNSGLMAIFFFGIGLEVRREFDIGDLRERRRFVLPVLAGAGGALLPVLIFVALNASSGSTRGWGIAMSTDTAFALGAIALLGDRVPAGLQTLMLNVSVVDDFIALAVISIAYSEHISAVPLAVAVGLLAVTAVLVWTGVLRGGWFAVAGIAIWGALWQSGVDPIAAGLVLGLLAYAYPAGRDELERASSLFRSFREQPSPELEREVRLGLAAALSPNERLQRIIRPWTAYVIVPLFALANTGVRVSGDNLAHAARSPITWGVVVGLVVGKPLAFLITQWLGIRLSRGWLVRPVGWGAIAIGGTAAGVGFTVSLLIATISFEGTDLAAAKIGILAAAVLAFALTALVTFGIQLLPERIRCRLMSGTDGVIDLAEPVDPERDHLTGPVDAPITIVEYGDFECPFCAQAAPDVTALLAERDDVRFVWRHLPLTDVHPHAQLAAEASEVAAAHGKFWEMHDLLLAHGEHLEIFDILRYARDLGFDQARFKAELHAHRTAARVADDVESADLSRVSGTPSFFVNGRRHQGGYDLDSLRTAVETARRPLPASD